MELLQLISRNMAAFLYLGAGLGLFLYGLISGEKGDPLPGTSCPKPSA